jgi:hypothetical protein
MVDSIQMALDQSLKDYGGKDRVISIITNPDWSHSEAEHDWRQEIYPSMRRIWGLLSLETRIVAYMLAVRCENSYWG